MAVNLASTRTVMRGVMTFTVDYPHMASVARLERSSSEWTALIYERACGREKVLASYYMPATMSYRALLSWVEAWEAECLATGVTSVLAPPESEYRGTRL